MEVGFSALNTSVRGPFSVKCFLRSLTSCHKVCIHLFCWDVILPMQSLHTAGYFRGTSIGFTGYGLDGPGIESRWGEIFRTCPGRPWGPPSLLYSGYQVFPGGKERPGRDADPSPLLVPRSRKSRAIPLLPLWAVLPVQSSVPVQGWPLPFTFRIWFNTVEEIKSTWQCLNTVTLQTVPFAVPVRCTALLATILVRNKSCSVGLSW